MRFGLITALIPAVYFEEGKQVDEPADAGLFVKPTNGIEFEKVVANDPDVMLFQVGEFGQIVTNDAIKATEYRVQRPTANRNVQTKRPCITCTA